MAKFERVDIGGNRGVLVNRTNKVVDGYRRLIAAEDTQAPGYIRKGETIYMLEELVPNTCPSYREVVQGMRERGEGYL
jgi:hypothetical protein